MAKHARWWLKIFSSGIGHVKIVHLSGCENVGADTLSRSLLTTETTEATDLDEFVLWVISGEISYLILLHTCRSARACDSSATFKTNSTQFRKTLVTQ